MNARQTDFLRHIRSVMAKQASGGLSDQQLLETFLSQRSEAHFAALVERHGAMVFGVCRRLLRHVQDAEDAFQATFLALARQAAPIRRQEALGSWLHGVAYRIAEKMKRAAARRAVHEGRLPPRSTGDAIEDITWRELRSILDEELQKLPEKYRAPLVLCYLEARTQDEAARQLGWSKSTFSRRMNRARELLAHRLTRRGLTLPAILTAPLLIDGAAMAALPPLLAANAVRAGLASVLGNTVSGIVSAQVVVLAESGVGSLLAKKACVVVVALVLLGLGVGGLLAHRAVQEATTPAPAAPPQATRSASMDHAIKIMGRVLDPDGKPFAGARLFLLPDDKREKANASARAITDKDGRFHFTAEPADFGPQSKGVLVATAKGFGLDWINVQLKGKREEFILRLVADDVSIVGRFLDLEGKPITGVAVQVSSVRKQADGSDLASWVERNVKAGRVFDAELDKMKLLLPAGLDVTTTTSSSVDGRIRLSGFGRDRALRLAVRGQTIADEDFFAVTRSGPIKGWIGHYPGLYGACFDYVLVPCKPVVGTVRDKRTGKPLAGITVAVMGGRYWCETKSDNQGRYRIAGLGKSQEYDAGAGGMPYINCSKMQIPDTPGLEPLEVSFELDRGIAMKGRLIDKTTGKPVHGRVSYRALPDNPHLKDFTDLNKGGILAFNPGDTATDGSFTVIAIPGPGRLTARANDASGFAYAADGDDRFHARVQINPSENDAKSTTCEIALESAKVLKGSVIGPDGQPLAGVYAAGRYPVVPRDLFAHEKLETASFEVGGMEADHPRTLVFLHPEKKLGKVVKLQGNETEPLLVRLQPLDAALGGRILDARGRPWPGLKMHVRTILGTDVRKDKTYPPEFKHADSAWQKLGIHEPRTDRHGRFHITGLMPGLKYILIAREESAPPGTPFAYHNADLIVTIEAGKTKDLGDLKSKQTLEKGAKVKP